MEKHAEDPIVEPNELDNELLHNEAKESVRPKIEEAFGVDLVEAFSTDTELMLEIAQAVEHREWSVTLIRRMSDAKPGAQKEIVAGVVGLCEGAHYVDRIHGTNDESATRLAFALKSILARKEMPIMPGQVETTERERHIFNRALSEVKAVRQRFLDDPFVVSFDQVRVFESEEALEGAPGRWNPLDRDLNVVRLPSEIAEYGIMVHELFHSASFQALRIDDVDKHIYSYRSGLGLDLQIEETKKLKAHLRVLNEAVTEELARRIVVSIQPGDELFPDFSADRLAVLKGYEEKGDTHSVDIVLTEYYSTKQLEDGTWIANMAGYVKERKHMWSLLQVLVERGGFSEDITTAQAAFDEIVHLYFSGNLVPLGRAMKQAFDKDAFRSYLECQTLEECEQWLGERVK